MEITGRITHALELRQGTSARTGNTWMSQSFVIETHDQYPRRCVFDVFGEDRLKEFNIQPGQELTVSFDIDAHEYNGRWFNSIRAWRVMPAQAGVPPMGAPIPQPGVTQPAPGAQQFGQAPTGPVAPAPAVDGDSADDLPF